MRPLIPGNWKTNGLTPQLVEIEAIAASVKATPPFTDILICPPSTLIARAVQTASGRIVIGGQDCHSEIAGAFTGSVSAEMLKDAGASAVIVGHSERRQHHGETDAIVAAKARAAWRTGILAISPKSILPCRKNGHRQRSWLRECLRLRAINIAANGDSFLLKPILVSVGGEFSSRR